MTGTQGVRAAELVIACAELGPEMSFWCEELGFRVDAVRPADDPREVLLSAHGLRLRLRLRRGAAASGATVVRLACEDPGTLARALAEGGRELVAPSGTKIELGEADPPVVLPPLEPARVVTRMGQDGGWIEGRAGMRYRDLVPGRLGGRVVASHIRIVEGGPVPDYVHFHEIHVQMIYCARGWVRVVYEDQGPPFVLRAGDCVLQPPRIRHRVLESSAGLEVIELSCPADHLTRVDHELELPTPAPRPGRSFSGQRFVRHELARASWGAWRHPGFEARDLGVAEASSGLASVCVVRRRASGSADTEPEVHDKELRFGFVLAGQLTLCCDGHEDERALSRGDAFVLPAGLGHHLRACSTELELLELSIPA